MKSISKLTAILFLGGLSMTVNSATYTLSDPVGNFSNIVGEMDAHMVHSQVVTPVSLASFEGATLTFGVGDHDQVPHETAELRVRFNGKDHHFGGAVEDESVPGEKVYGHVASEMNVGLWQNHAHIRLFVQKDSLGVVTSVRVVDEEVWFFMGMLPWSSKNHINLRFEAIAAH